MKWQRQNNSHGVAQDEDLQRAIVKMDAREAKGRPTQRSQNYSKVDQEEEE